MTLETSKYRSDQIDFYSPNNVTLVRLIAALLVLISHSYGLLGKNNSEPFYILSNGEFTCSRVGLVFFFFLSGFLVTGSFFKSENIQVFFIKRILRIFPALIVLIFFTVFVVGPFFTTLFLKEYFSSKETWQYLLGGITLIKLRFHLPEVFNENGVNGSLWSLPIEFRLYFLLAIIMALARLKRGVLLQCFFLGMVALCILCLDKSSLFHNLQLKPYLEWGAPFFCGSLAFMNKSYIRLNITCLLILLLLWILGLAIPVLRSLGELLLFSYGSLFLAYKLPVLGEKFFKCNDYSYSIYIYSFIVQQSYIAINAVMLTPTILTALTIATLLPICYISWNFIEKPILLWKKRRYVYEIT